MYILNEKDYIRSVLASKKKPEDLSIGYLIVLTAKYYYINNENIEKKQLVEIVTNKISDMMIYGYQEYKWIRKIEKVCDIFYDNEKDKKSKKKEEINEKDKQLRELKYVPIYQEEIDNLKIAMLLYDIGNLLLPPEIFKKTTPLTDSVNNTLISFTSLVNS